MMQTDAEHHIDAFLVAIRRLVDSGSAVPAATSPVFVAGGYGISFKRLDELTDQADRADADLLYALFEAGAEDQGPCRIVAVLARSGARDVKLDCSLWLGRDDRTYLIARDENFGWASFNADGMDYNPRKFAKPLEAGFTRAVTKLRSLTTEMHRHEKGEEGCLAA